MMKLPALLVLLLPAAAIGALEAQSALEGPRTKELAEMYENDQAERKRVFLEANPSQDAIHALVTNDNARLRRAREIVRAQELETADDYFHAAMILQHGGEPDDYLLAHALSTVAGFKGHETGRWLSAAALDRYLVNIGQSQVFGTQRNRANSGPVKPFDGDLLTDQIRKAFEVPVPPER